LEDVIFLQIFWGKSHGIGKYYRGGTEYTEKEINIWVIVQ